MRTFGVLELCESYTGGEKMKRTGTIKDMYHTRPTLLRSKRLNGLEETASVCIKFFRTSEDVVWM